MPVPVKLGLIGQTGEAVKFSIDGEAAGSRTDDASDRPDVMDIELELTQPFVSSAVPSILRGFSAPVRLQDDLSVDELAILATYDTDGFNRYEACQRLAHLALEQRLSSDTQMRRLNCADKGRQQYLKTQSLRVIINAYVFPFLVSLRLSTAR